VEYIENQENVKNTVLSTNHIPDKYLENSAVVESRVQENTITHGYQSEIKLMDDQHQGYSEADIGHMEDSELTESIKSVCNSNDNTEDLFCKLLIEIKKRNLLKKFQHKSIKSLLNGLGISEKQVKQGYKYWNHLEICKKLDADPLECKITATRLLSTKKNKHHAINIWDLAKSKAGNDTKHLTEKVIKEAIKELFPSENDTLHYSNHVEDILNLLVSKYPELKTLITELFAHENKALLSDMSKELAKYDFN